jgi:hypothetical protein
MALGYGSASSIVGSNNIQLGNSSIAKLFCQVALTVVSDERDKTDFVDLDAGLDFVNQLKPLRYKWNQRGGGLEDRKDVGFTAQDLLAVQENTGIDIPNLVDTDDSNKYKVMYTQLIPVLVKAIQDLNHKVDELTSEITELKNK